MRTEKAVEISVKTIFTGRRSPEQAFVELIRRKRTDCREYNLEPSADRRYTEPVVFPFVREAPERGIRHE